MSDYDEIFGWDREDVETQRWRQSLREGAVSCLRKLESGDYADTPVPDVAECKRDIFDWHLNDSEDMREHAAMRQTVVDALGKLYSGGYAGASDVDAGQMDKEFYAAFGCADEVEYVQAVEDDPSIDRSIRFDEQWEERKRMIASRPENRERCARLSAFSEVMP